MFLCIYEKEMIGEDDKSKALRKGRGRGKERRRGLGEKKNRTRSIFHPSSLVAFIYPSHLV